MFNDEIDHVRILSIDALFAIGNMITLKPDQEQLELILGVLDDTSEAVRSKVHHLIGLVGSRRRVQIDKRSTA